MDRRCAVTAKSDTARLLKVVDDLYDSVLDDAAFPGALQSLADYAGAKGTFWVMADRTTGQAIRSLGVGTDPAVQEAYDRYYGARDIRIPPSLSMPLGVPITEHTHLERGEFERSEIYNDFLVPHDGPHILAVWATRTPKLLAAVSLQRSCRQGSFTSEDEARLAPLMPHLLRALEIRRLVEPIRHRQHVYLELLDRLPFGVILLDDGSRVLELSATAETIVRRQTALTVRGASLRALRPSDDAELHCAIRTASCKTSIHGGRGSTVTIHRTDGKRSLTAAVPIRAPQVFMSIPPACVVVIFDPEGQRATEAQVVAAALHLTDAEARLACILFTGVTLKEAANQLQLSVKYLQNPTQGHLRQDRLPQPRRPRPPHFHDQPQPPGLSSVHVRN
jgi:hypothetical protein